MSERIFDHMNGEPEDERFCVVARHMRRSAWWRRVPKWTEPAPVAGEIDRGLRVILTR